MVKCPKCGWDNADGVAKCANCFEPLPAQEGQAPQQPEQPQQPQQPYQPTQPPYAFDQQARQLFEELPDYMTLSIVATVITALCCNPISLICSIIAIVKASSAKNKKMVGDYAGATQEANTARVLLIVAAVVFALGIIANIIYVAVFMAPMMEQTRGMSNPPFAP